MIFNSYVWKDELRKEYENFKLFLLNLECPENEDKDNYLSLTIEKFFFVSSFIIRKLIESGKLSDELLALNISATKNKFISKGKSIYFLNYLNIEDYYILHENTHVTISIKDICNKFIHSFLFIPIFGEESKKEKYKFYGVLINSDYDKNKALYYVELSDFSRLLEEVIKDEVNYITYSSRTGKEKRFRTAPNDSDTKSMLVTE